MRFGQTLLRCGLVAACLAAAAMETSAQDVTVRGARTCRAYLDASRNNTQEGVNQALNDLTWFLGYESGLAVATHVDILGKSDPESRLTWVEAYCQAYPARYLSDAGDLYYRFRIEQMKTNPK